MNKNQSPTKLFNKVTKQYLNLKFDKNPLENKTEVKTDTRFFKLPCIGKCSNISQKKNQNLVQTFCKDIDVKIVLTPFKISNKFSYKGPLQVHLQSFILYKFICANYKICMWMKPQDTPSPESMSTCRKTPNPKSSNICKNHVYVIVCKISNMYAIVCKINCFSVID